MNYKGCKASGRGLWYYPGICLEGLRKTTKNFSQDSQHTGWDLSPGPPKYQTGMLTAQMRRSTILH